MSIKYCRVNTRAVCGGDARYVFKCSDENNEPCTVTRNGERKMWEAPEDVKYGDANFRLKTKYVFLIVLMAIGNIFFSYLNTFTAKTSTLTSKIVWP